MRLVCVGVNHRSAPVELRETVAFSAESTERALAEMKALDGVGEALILSTCNRVELYAGADPEVSPYQLSSFLYRFHDIEPGSMDEHLFRLVGEDAVSHLFRVASSLDAIVVGEPQILGQVKDAYFRAAGCGATGPILNRSFHTAFSVAKRVRTDTAIASSAVSVSYAGVELARKVFGEISGMECLLIGAGDMGELAARHFMERGARLYVVNRSFERARRLAENFDGVARDLSELPSLLEEMDVVLCSTSAPGFVITKDVVKRAVKRRRFRPLLFIDIAVPRDVDPAVADLDATYVYDVDDLTQVVEENLEGRRAEADRAEGIVREEVSQFVRRTRERRAVPTIKALRERLLEVADGEANKTLVVLGDKASEKQKKSVEAMARAIVNKILHEPITRLKDQSLRGDPASDDLFAAVQELFQLRIEEEDSGAGTEELLREFEEAEAALGDVLEIEERLQVAMSGGSKG